MNTRSCVLVLLLTTGLSIPAAAEPERFSMEDCLLQGQRNAGANTTQPFIRHICERKHEEHLVRTYGPPNPGGTKLIELAPNYSTEPDGYRGIVATNVSSGITVTLIELGFHWERPSDYRPSWPPGTAKNDPFVKYHDELMSRPVPETQTVFFAVTLPPGKSVKLKYVPPEESASLSISSVRGNPKKWRDFGRPSEALPLPLAP